MTLDDHLAGLAVMVGRVEGKIDSVEKNVTALNKDVSEMKVQIAKIEKNTNGAAESVGRVIDKIPFKTKQLILIFLLAMVGGMSGTQALSVMG